MARTICGPPSLRSPGGGSITNWKCRSTRRPPSIVLMAQNHQTKAPTFAGIRAMQSPTATPLFGSKSKFPNRSSRGQKNTLVTRATLNSFTGEILNMFALAQEETQHLLKIGSNQILWSHISQCVCILLLDLILNEVNYIQINSLPQ